MADSIDLDKDRARTTDFLIEVALGKVAKHSLVSVVGRNRDVDTTIIDIGMLDGFFPWPTIASRLVALSTDPTDTILGTGARKLRIDGLDASFNPIFEEIEMDGGTESTPTTQSFIRVNKSTVIEAGTYATTEVGANNGNIIIGPLGGGTPLSFIANVDIDPGASQDFKYTVPNGFSAVVVGVGANIDSTKTGTMVFNIRPDADIIVAPFASKISTVNVAGISGLHTVPKELLNYILEAKTDLWATGLAGVNNTEMEISARLLLIED